ncbi:MAG: PAS domain-containing protein [Sporocytophaga sp.]|uniref:PAS domain-containing protein n=1 Tax=Sporocytophaga sp. TaxID=2231183 RepID=UPI001B0DA272|nr:PAS domain-containing protein [Sporocytophaga sp.]MBO9701827.1 PAS domain-containing protein [Sporocytophaga sp.]
MKLKYQLILLFLLIILLITSTISILFYKSQIHVLRSYIENQLRSISKTKEIRIASIIKSRKELIGLAAFNPLIVDGLNIYLIDPSKKHQSEINYVLNKYKQSIESFKEGYVLSKKGEIIASTDSSVIGKNWSSYESFRVSVSGRKFLDDLYFDKGNQLRILLSSPIYFENRIIGVFIMSRRADEILSLSNDYTGLGNTGETYLGKKFGDSIVFLNPLRFDNNAALKRSIPAKDSSTSIGEIINLKRDTLVRSKDYEGNDVLAALSYFPETRWGMVTEVDFQEAMVPIILLRNRLLLFNAIAILMAALVAYLLGSSIVKPIEKLTSTANKFSEGDFSQLSEIKLKNEIGDLAHSFNLMAKSLQEKITRSNTMFSTVFESVEEGIILLKIIRDSSGKIKDFEFVLVNRWAEILLDRKRTDLIGKRWAEEYPYVKDIGLYNLQVKVAETGKPLNTDFFYGFQGLNVWYRNKVVKIGDDELLATFDDITQLKESNIQLENLQSIFLQSQTLGKIGSFEWNFQNKTLTVTPEMSEVLCSNPIKNTESLSIEGHPFEEFIHPDDREKANQAIRKAIFDRKPYNVEFTILCPENIIKYVWSRGKVFYDNLGEPIKMIGTVLDISEWKKSKLEIEKRKILLSLAEEMANLGSYEFDIENKKNVWSDQLYRIYGYEPNEFELTEENQLKIIHPDDKEYAKRLFDKWIFQEDAFEYQFKFVRKDSTIGVGYGKVKVIKNENNRVIKVTGFVQDITERVKMLEQLKSLNTELETRVNERTKELSISIDNLKKLNDSLDKYAYIISHDLKAPLSVIEGLVPFIKEDCQSRPLDDEGIKMLDMVIGKVEDMKSIIENVLKSAKKEKQIKEPINLLHLCQDVLTTLNPPSHFHIHISYSLPIVNYNRTSLKQILQNLIGNAIKYMDKENPDIKIGSVEMESYYQISVRDNGSGITEGKLLKIFEPFEIAHKKEKIDSHGIGLSIVKEIVESNGGRVWVESELGKGSSFYFTILK